MIIILQQQMKKRREGEESMMGQAIQKASQLINLLQKQNSQLKRKIDNLENELQRYHIENQEMKQSNKQLEEQLQKIQIKNEELKSKLQINSNSLIKSQQNLRKKIVTNKQLHQKISILNMKVKEYNRLTNDQKTKLLSLQNQNQYLLKKLKDYQDKQNLGLHKINAKYIDYQNEIKQIVRIKEAFARRCDQLKTDNILLTQKAAEYKQRLIEAEIYLPPQPHFPQYPQRDLKPIIDPYSSTYYLDLVDRLVKDKLGVIPELSFEGKLDQIGSFLTFRMSHIQKMCQGIWDKLQLKQWSKLQNLKDLNNSSYRIHSYLSELLNKSL